MRPESFIPSGELRYRILAKGDPGEGPVLLWVQRTQRATGNQAANLAVEIANRLGRGVIACFCLTPSYPGATLRAYHFMAEGLAELPDSFAARGIGWTLRVGDPAREIPRLSQELGAACIVTDLAPTTLAREWKADVARSAGVPVLAVDVDVVVPTAHFPKLEWAPRTIRPKISALLDRYLQPIEEPIVSVPSTVREGPDPLQLIEELPLDRTVGPSPKLRGGTSQARARLRRFCDSHLRNYEIDRNRSDIDGSSGMSPYLHFGQISPIEIALTALESLRGEGAESAITSFFNELIVQRELAINFALHEPNYATFAGIPEWGRKTLADHQNDPRPRLYSRQELESGRTGDALWNAAQRQMIHEGFMPNRLRMYWAKHLLLWTSTAEEAFEIAVSFNDRYFVDGRDPNGYAGISWSIGGRHDRPFPPNRPIFGLVRPMGRNAMKKHFDIERYIATINTRYPEQDN